MNLSTELCCGIISKMLIFQPMDQNTEALAVTLGRWVEKRTQLLGVRHEQGCCEDKGITAVEMPGQRASGKMFSGRFVFNTAFK